MSKAIPDLDDLYQLGNEATRRKFLSTLATTGIGLAGLRKATKRAFGEQPDGVPLVWRYDRFGNPETVRYIPKERYRRIQVYYELPPSTIYEKAKEVNGIKLFQRSAEPTDLVLKILVDNNTRSVRQKLPNRIKNVPVVAEERKTDPTPAACDRRITDFYDPLPANPQIKGHDSDGNFYGQGTLGVVCYNDNSDDPYECYITAAHVTEDGGDYAPYLTHDGEDDDGNSREEKVGEYVTHSPLGDTGMDVVKYRYRSGTADPDIRGNADDHLGYLSGTWSHSGLTDRTSGSDTLPVEFAGKSTCYATTECYDTSKTSSVEYQADYSPNEVTDGDSGGPFVDNDDYLVGTFSTYCEDCEESHGPTAKELLDRVNAQLTDPQKT